MSPLCGNKSNVVKNSYFYNALFQAPSYHVVASMVPPISILWLPSLLYLELNIVKLQIEKVKSVKPKLAPGALRQLGLVTAARVSSALIGTVLSSPILERLEYTCFFSFRTSNLHNPHLLHHIYRPSIFHDTGKCSNLANKLLLFISYNLCKNTQ